MNKFAVVVLDGGNIVITIQEYTEDIPAIVMAGGRRAFRFQTLDEAAAQKPPMMFHREWDILQRVIEIRESLYAAKLSIYQQDQTEALTPPTLPTVMITEGEV